jgi:hypothetical protein
MCCPKNACKFRAEISDLRVDPQKVFVIPLVVRTRAEKFTRENRELPNLADVE